MKKMKAGDKAQVKYHPATKVFIIDVQEQTCYAGVTQIWYTGRCYTPGRMGGTSKEYARFSSIELEPIPPASAELSTYVANYKKLKARKETLIREQKFEEATKARNEERLMKAEIEELAEKEGLSLEELLQELL